MMLFLGNALATGINRLPEWQDYWSQNPILGSPAIVQGMSLTRFKALMSNLHVNDNSNAYILACETPNVPKHSLKNFILELVEELLSKHNSRKRAGRRPTADVPPSTRFNDRHFPDRIKSKLQCVVCALDNQRRRVTFACSDCNPKHPVPLCPVPCFRIFHTKN